MIVQIHTMGAFNNHVDKKGWVGGQPNVHVCPREVGRWIIQCPRGQFTYYSNQIKDVNFLVGSCFTSIKITIFSSPTSFPPVKLGTYY